MGCDHELTLEVRDAIRRGLLVRAGVELNELTASERANNLALALCEEFEIRRRAEPTSEETSNA